MNMRKKLILVAVVLTAFWGKSYACGGWDDFDSGYHNLFAQEIMKDPRYRPFLLTYESKYYPSDTLRNGNIEEWQKYLGLSYDDTKYLVFNSSRSDLQDLTKGKAVSDWNLSFATPDFVKRHKQALLYLAYAKYLEPYMRIIPGEVEGWDYWDLPKYDHNAGDLDYDKVKTVLTKSWNAETDNELKLRYGYQLVRLAHYTRRFEEAVQLFDQYVEPLKMRTEMYYYALAQKAGALRGMGETLQANREYIHVFTNSNDLKTVAYSSMTMGWENDINFADFLSGAADANERNDIFFMMGYGDFNNPVNEIEKIIVNDPDAIQAKVLMVRAVNLIERTLLNTYLLIGDEGKTRYPHWSAEDTEIRPFFNQAIRVSDAQCSKASDKNFWNLVSSYLHFLNHDFELSSNYLGKVKSDDALSKTMVRNLTAYIDICRQPSINADVENRIFGQYADMITGTETYSFNNADPSFVKLVLANRYDLQGEKAKAFLTLNHVRAVEDAPNEALVDEIRNFLNKKKKTSLEEHIATKGTVDVANPDNYLAYVKGVIRLTEGDLKEAKNLFAKQTRLKVSKRIFGHNIRVWYSGDEDLIMRDDYLSEFPFLRDGMTELEVTDALMQLQKIGDKKGDEAAKANYLIANFFYNVSTTGYFRHYLRFDNDNGFCYDKFSFDAEKSYKSTLDLSVAYLEKAKKTAVDRELKAHLAFAEAKAAQQVLEHETNYWNFTMMVPNGKFDELDQYKDTQYQKAVTSNCLYYREYHN